MTTIGLILDLLKVDDFHDCSETIDIAKGKYQVPMSYKQMINTIKRNKNYGRN